MILNRASFLACAGIAALAAGAANPARAAVDDYTVEAGERVEIALEVCSAETQLAVRGNSKTDLDFVLVDPSGETLVTDQGIDDYLSVVLEHGAEGCASFGLQVANIGDEGNDFTVVLEPVVESSTRVQKFIIQPGATETHSFRACGTGANVSARGDGDTDLDFIIRNSDGAVVHEDDDTSDETSVELAGLLSDCEQFEIEVANLGEVYNALMLVVEPKGANPAAFAGTAPTTSLTATGVVAVADEDGERRVVSAEGSGAGDYRAQGNTRTEVNLPVCDLTRLEVRGTGATDLDFTITDPSGATVHADSDLSDVTFAAIEPSGECETFTLSVDNLGEADNDFSVALIDPATRVGASGQGEYRVRANSATKVALRVCDRTKVSAQGGGGTDLDFDVTDATGESIHTDYDLTDKTEFMLDPGSGCKDYQMQVNNLGDTNNMLTVGFGSERGASGSATATAKGNGGGQVSAGPVRPHSDIAPPNSLVGVRKDIANRGVDAANANRTVSLLNNTGEALQSLFWSNSATLGWGEDKLGDALLGKDQQWNVNVTDGSESCLFDFRAVTASDREIEIASVNVCEVASIAFE